MNIYEQQVKKFYSEIWDNNNFEEVLNVLNDNFKFHGSLGDEKQEHNDLIEYVNFVHSGLSNYKCIIEELVIQPEKVFARAKYTGFHDSEFICIPATNKEVSWSGADYSLFLGEKVSNLWVLGDINSLERQLSN